MLEELEIPVSEEQRKAVNKAAAEYINNSFIPLLKQFIEENTKELRGDINITIRRKNMGAVEVTASLNSSINKTKRERVQFKGRRPNFKFSMVGIPIGATVVFTPTNIETKVCSDSQVEFNRHNYKLSVFVKKFIPKTMENSSGAYQGSKYFSYKGELLEDIRKRLENE